MKAIERKGNEKGHVILTCESSYLFGLLKPKTKFLATKEYPRGYWNWRKLPNKTLIGTKLSFQLDDWCRDLEK